MNSDKHTASGMRGNALIYVLLALALLGALTMLIATQQNESSDLSSEKADLLATKTIAFAGSAKMVVDQMMMSGTPVTSLSFIRPNEAAYDTAPHINKVFHPEGGGLILDKADPALFTAGDAMPVPGWYMDRSHNIQWTPTAANEVILSAYGISMAVCESINYKLTGSKTIPVVTGDNENFFVDTVYSGTPNQNLTTVVCAACDGYPSLCVDGNGPEADDYVYYTIISAQ